jgi:hypothetical protein
MSEATRDEPNDALGVLREILKWIRVTSIPNVKKLLVETLDDDKSKLAYHHSDGRSSRDVAKAASCSQATVVSYWKRWFRNGLAEPIGVQRGDRFKKIFELEDFGIAVPSVVQPISIPPQEGGQPER